MKLAFDRLKPGLHAVRFLIFKLALRMLLIIQQMRNEKEQLKMKTPNPILLSFSYSQCGSFTLPIQQKAVRPALSPYSSKKLPADWPQWPAGTAPRSLTDFTAVSSFQRGACEYVDACRSSDSRVSPHPPPYRFQTARHRD